MSRLLLSLLLMAGGIQVLQAQTENAWRLRYLTTEEGLSQNTVDHMIRDSRGFLWIATWNGLCRYDGYSFQVIEAEPGRPGLPDNFTQTLCEGPDHRLWIGTANGIAIYDLVKEQFESLEWADTSLRTASISALAVDQQGLVWIGTQESGLYVVSAQFGTSTTPQVSHLPTSGNPVNSLFPSRKGGCYLGTYRRLMRVERENGQLKIRENRSLPIANLAIIRAIHEEPDTSLWVGTDFGLYWFADPNSAPEVFLHHPDDPTSLIHNTVTAIDRDADNRLLIGTFGGLCVFQEPGSFDLLFDKPGSHTQLNNPFVNSLLCDSLGNVWVGTEKGGLNTWNIYQKPFGFLTREEGNPHSLSHKTVNSLLVEEDYLWVGTAGGGLNRVSTRSGQMEQAVHDPYRPQSLSNDFVTAIHRNRSSDLWVATWGGGLNRLNDPEMKSFARFLPDAAGVGSNFISSMIEDPRGFFVVGTTLGLLWFEPETGEFGKIALGQAAGLEQSAIGCLLLDEDGYYWVGTIQGCYRFAASHLVPGREASVDVSFFSRKTHQNLGMSGDYIISLHQVPGGGVWLGTFGSGLLRAEMENGRVTGFTGITQADGLCNNTIYSIEHTAGGELWLSTDYGMARFQPKTGKISNYYRSDGLGDNQFYWGASGKGPDGRLYFGGVSGVTYFSPAKISPYPFAPQVAITDFKVLNQSLAVGEERYGAVALKRSTAMADSVDLSHKDNVFSIEFAALAYYLPDRLTYQYRMQGVDPDWVEVPASRHFATYTNLSGGSYLFEVRALNEDGIVSGNTASIRVMVRPPFWKTSWFTGLMVLLGALLVMAYIRLRTHYLHQQKDKLEQEVLRRTRQVEEQNAKLERQKGHLLELNEKVKMVNQLRLRFFTNISHEFRTPLTLIIDPILALLEDHPADSATGRTLRIVHRNAQRLLHLINQLMHFRRLESGKLKVQAGEADLLAFVEEVFTSFSHLASSREIDYTLKVSGIPEGPTWFDPEKLENILFNLLGNAFKYTPAEGSISLQVVFDENHRVRMLVQDSGPGIPEDQQRAIFHHFYQVETQANRHLHGSGIGLALSRELVKSLHGVIWVESDPGQGSTFGIDLPYKRESFGPDEVVSDIVPYHSNLSTQVMLAGEELDIRNEEPEESGQQDVRKPLVLIAEDNYDLRAFLSQSLAGHYRILEADNGKDALELARKYTPHLIVSDVMMPEMDGLELCSQLKGNVQTSHIPVILLTARDAVEHWVEGLETGADDYIPKPFNLKILRTRIDNLVASRQQLKLLFTKGQMPGAREATSSSLDQEFLQKVYDVLEDRATEPDFSHDELADVMCISRSLLYKKLKEISGMSVTEFINSFRLRQACKLLNEGQLPISAIAFSCGFNDPKYFSRVFRKYYGMSPSEYVQSRIQSA